MTSNAMHRRTVLGGAAALAAGFALAGCGDGDDGRRPRERKKGQKIS